MKKPYSKFMVGVTWKDEISNMEGISKSEQMFVQVM